MTVPRAPVDAAPWLNRATATIRGPAQRALGRLRDLERRTRPADPETADALNARWQELPEHVRTPAQMLGRKFTGCEGTHGVFPQCNFGCRPCYHAANANQVAIDGDHTVAEVDRQMAYLRARRGPGQYAQLIGGEVSLLPAEAHAEALEVMRRHGRIPMSFTHGDFDYDYLRRLAVRPDGTPASTCCRSPCTSTGRCTGGAARSARPVRPSCTRSVAGSSSCSPGSPPSTACAPISRTT